MQNLNVTYLQSNIFWEGPKKNRNYFSEKIKSINKAADLIVLPEMFTTAFPVDPHQFAEPIDGPTVHWMKKNGLGKKTPTSVAAFY